MSLLKPGMPPTLVSSLPPPPLTWRFSSVLLEGQPPPPPPAMKEVLHELVEAGDASNPRLQSAQDH